MCLWCIRTIYFSRRHINCSSAKFASDGKTENGWAARLQLQNRSLGGSRASHIFMSHLWLPYHDADQSPAARARVPPRDGSVQSCARRGRTARPSLIWNKKQFLCGACCGYAFLAFYSPHNNTVHPYTMKCVRSVVPWMRRSSDHSFDTRFGDGLRCSSSIAA